jgi:hypothetical protein
MTAVWFAAAALLLSLNVGGGPTLASSEGDPTGWPVTHGRMLLDACPEWPCPK